MRLRRIESCARSEIIVVEGYFDSSLGALQVEPLGRRLGLYSALTSLKTIPFRDMNVIPEALNVAGARRNQC